MSQLLSLWNVCAIRQNNENQSSGTLELSGGSKILQGCHNFTVYILATVRVNCVAVCKYGSHHAPFLLYIKYQNICGSAVECYDRLTFYSGQIVIASGSTFWSHTIGHWPGKVNLSPPNLVITDTVKCHSLYDIVQIQLHMCFGTCVCSGDSELFKWCLPNC